MASKLLLIGLLPLAACGDGANAPVPTPGSIAVTATTTGTSLDPDGYTVVLDPQGPATRTQAIAVNGGTASFSDVAPGQHTVALEGVADHCVVSPSAAQPVAVAASGALAVAFTIACTTPPGPARIAFTSERDGNREIYVMDVDGSHPTRLTNDIGTDNMPAWSPDATQIAFSSDRAGTADIYIMNAEGTGLTSLAQGPEYDESPAWAPDGSKIAFVRSVPDDPSIFVMNPDGSGVTRVSAQFGDHPAWSPDGTEIAFTGLDGISVMSADGSNPHLVAYAGSRPAWSPDGSRIAYIGVSIEGDPGLYVVNSDGSNSVALTSDRDDAPAWSPDGRIAFDREQPEHFGQQEIYVMNADGSGLIRLTNDPAPDEDPAWSP